jgi:hypothetical protein
MLDHKQHPAKIQLDNPPDSGTAKGMLGTHTFIMSHLITPQQAQQIAQNADPNQGAPENQDTPTDSNTQMQGLEQRIFDELGTLKQEIQKISGKDSTKVLQDLKTQIDSALISE